MRAVVTGANRGIGLELVRQLLARGDHVDACARDPDAPGLRALPGTRLRRYAVDVTDPVSVAALAEALRDDPVDTLFNAAGVYGGARQQLADLAQDLALPALESTYAVNAAGALRMVVALLPNLRRGDIKKLVHLTSGMASIADNASGGAYAYRMSKAALNMMSRSLAADLRGDGIVSVVMDAGCVPTHAGSEPPTVADAARGILRQTDRATPLDTGAFSSWRGGHHPW